MTLTSRGSLDPLFFAEACDGLDILQGPYLLVAVLDGDQDGVDGDGGANRFGVHHALAVDFKVRDAEPLFLQRPGRVEHGEVLDLGDYEVLALLRAQRHGHALEGQVAGLGTARGEDELLRLRAEQAGELRPSAVQGLPRLDSQGVTEFGRGHGIGLEEIRSHRVQHALVQAGAGAVVKVDGLVEHG